MFVGLTFECQNYNADVDFNFRPGLISCSCFAVRRRFFIVPVRDDGADKLTRPEEEIYTFYF